MNLKRLSDRRWRSSLLDRVGSYYEIPSASTRLSNVVRA